MKIKFVGAINHITGSCSWLQYSQTGTQFLVDCGMFQGGPVLELLNAEEFPFDPKKIKFVLLTHAHLDHCGLIPKLYRDGFVGNVYATAATAKLADIGLRDAAKIQEKSENPIYTVHDVGKIKFFKVDERPDFHWGKSISVGENITAAFLRSSHILGAASITVNWIKNDIENGPYEGMCFSGDIGNNTRECSYLPLMKENQYPFPGTKYLLVESTYGHNNREEKFKSTTNRQNELWRIIQEARNKQGKIMIPVFSIHRSQEILIDLVSTLKKNATEDQKWRILCHSPMIAKVCQVYSEEFGRTVKNKEGEDKKLYMRTDFLEYVEENSEDFIGYLFGTGDKKKPEANYTFKKVHKIKVASKKPNYYDQYDIILASSGMCAAGPIRDYLDEYERDSNNTILITGYQASPEGRMIQERAIRTDLDEAYAQVENMSGYYSGHADQEILLDYVFNMGGVHEDKDLTPATVFINHGGNIQSKIALKSAIEQRNKNPKRQRPIEQVVIAQKIEQWLNLTTGELEENISTADLMKEIRAVQKKLRDHSRALEEINQKLAK